MVPPHSWNGRVLCVNKQIKCLFGAILSAQGGGCNDPAASLRLVISECYEAGGGNGLQEAHSLVCVCVLVSDESPLVNRLNH